VAPAAGPVLVRLLVWEDVMCNGRGTCRKGTEGDGTCACELCGWYGTRCALACQPSQAGPAEAPRHPICSSAGRTTRGLTSASLVRPVACASRMSCPCRRASPLLSWTSEGCRGRRGTDDGVGGARAHPQCLRTGTRRTRRERVVQIMGSTR